MTINEIRDLIDRSLFASLGYTDERGRQNIRRVFCVWHKGLGTHLISTNTSSSHVKSLLKNSNACLYFSDDASFEAVCLYGKAEVSTDRYYKELLWNEGDEKYYPKGIDDDDYCVIVFTADSGRYYRYDGKADLFADEITKYDKECILENGYSKTQN
ncbi:MAG: pyridoxamine 5'-phosphate oxidase family protein [Ruminococcus sp.]|nr:pyridoxamine 5'-phosphate oxidase family protein [Ruminococcus sp.]